MHAPLRPRSHGQAFGGTYAIGLLFLRRQFAQERLGWNVPAAEPLPLPRARSDSPEPRAWPSESTRRRPAALAALVAPPEDDGTHGVFSEAAALARDAEHGAGAVDTEEAVVRVGGPARTEMRQVLPAPVSLSAYL